MVPPAPEGAPIVPDSLPAAAPLLGEVISPPEVPLLLAVQISLPWRADSQVPFTLSPFLVYEQGSPADLSLQAWMRSDLMEWRANAAGENAASAPKTRNEVKIRILRFTRLLLALVC